MSQRYADACRQPESLDPCFCRRAHIRDVELRSVERARTLDIEASQAAMVPQPSRFSNVAGHGHGVRFIPWVLRDRVSDPQPIPEGAPR